MKYYTFKFMAPLTPAQEECLYAGFSSFYYDVLDGLDKGITQANGKLYKKASNFVKRITNVDAAQMAIDRLELIKENIENHMEWRRTEPGKYEFWMAVELFEKAAPTMGYRLDRKLVELFNEQICPKLGIKKDEVAITTEVR